GEFARFQVRRREHTAARCCMGTACAGGVAVVAPRHEVRGLIPQPIRFREGDLDHVSRVGLSDIPLPRFEMSTRCLPRPRPWTHIAATALVIGALAPLGVRPTAQLIQVKTLPIADGDQWRFFPSANVGMAGVSIALSDTLL